jgi:hypothetical protein
VVSGEEDNSIHLRSGRWGPVGKERSRDHPCRERCLTRQAPDCGRELARIPGESNIASGNCKLTRGGHQLSYQQEHRHQSRRRLGKTLS